MPDLTPDWIAELERLLAVMTEGVWDDLLADDGCLVIKLASGMHLLADSDDIEGIVSAVNALPALLAERETLSKERDDANYGVGCLTAQVETLREALRFYADRRNYRPAAGSGDSYDAMVARDSYDGLGPGTRARTTLEITLEGAPDA